MSEFEDGSAESPQAEESAIYARLIQLLETEKAEIPGRKDPDQEIDRGLHGKSGGLYNIQQHRAEALTPMIEILREGRDRSTIIHWLERKISNDRERGKETEEDEESLSFLQTLEPKSEEEPRIAA